MDTRSLNKFVFVKMHHRRLKQYLLRFVKQQIEKRITPIPEYSSNLISVSLPPFTTSTERSGASPSHLPFLSLSIFSSYVLALHTAVLSSSSPCMGLSGGRAAES